MKFTGGAPHAYNEFEPVDAAKKSINLGIEDLQKQGVKFDQPAQKAEAEILDELFSRRRLASNENKLVKL